MCLCVCLCVHSNHSHTLRIRKTSGTLSVAGRIAYVPQTAWIQNRTLRDNILFGSEFVADKYQRVLKSCALEPDVKQLSAGDQTEIGDRGINLRSFLFGGLSFIAL